MSLSLLALLWAIFGCPGPLDGGGGVPIAVSAPHPAIEASAPAYRVRANDGGGGVPI